MTTRMTLTALALAAGALWLGSDGVEAQGGVTRCHGCYAFVEADGDPGRHKHALSVARTHIGRYVVRFAERIDGCFWQGTIGLGTFGGSVLSGTITVAALEGTNRAVVVRTRDADGAFANRPFNVLITC